MKSFIALFTAMLACLFFAQSDSAWAPINADDGNACSDKFGSVVNAIGKICT
jgi:hypothetical protein